MRGGGVIQGLLKEKVLLIFQKKGGGAIVPLSPPSSDGPATLNWPTPSRFDFFSFATLKFNFGENVCTCQRICPAHHMFSRKTNYELSPIFYGQETNYVFLLNCYYVSMTLWLKTFWNLTFENLSKCDAIHESFLTLKLPEDFFEGHFLREYKNVMLDTNWDTHNRNIPYQYIFCFSLLISLFFVCTAIGDLEKTKHTKPSEF